MTGKMEVPFLGKEVFEHLLADFREVHLAVAYHPKVVLPVGVATSEWRRGETLIVLHYGLDMPIPIEGWDIGEEGVRAVLSFDWHPHNTFVPWAAMVFARGQGLKKPRQTEPSLRPKLKLVD